MNKMQLGEPDYAPFKQLSSQQLVNLVLGMQPVDSIDMTQDNKQLLKQLLLDPVYHLK